MGRSPFMKKYRSKQRSTIREEMITRLMATQLGDKELRKVVGGISDVSGSNPSHPDFMPYTDK
jgi:hypothetical protein